MKRNIENFYFIPVIITIIITLVLYLLKFNAGLSDNSTDWSNFGAYFGGITIPIFTLMNIYLIIRSNRHIFKETEKNRFDKEFNNYYRIFLEDLKMKGLNSNVTIPGTEYVKSIRKVKSLTSPNQDELKIIFESYNNSISLLKILLEMICENESLSNKEKLFYIGLLQFECKDNFIKLLLIMINMVTYQNSKHLKAFLGFSLGIDYKFLFENLSSSISTMKEKIFQRDKSWIYVDFPNIKKDK